MATVITKHGETWDMLSYRIYGDEHHMNTLIDANIALRDTVMFPYGVEIEAPELPASTLVSDTLPAWKR